ncbi:unnamed protein product [Ambrosiozyma monospora]|uniref:Unnamed protein product n=1 Tax=Ambrosiozyma monospora TaxID=43982 RepID=A0ACB5TWI9_AMBMO|nr:unnamed protein product [Ambrosiozyma monospora]
MKKEMSKISQTELHKAVHSHLFHTSECILQFINNSVNDPSILPIWLDCVNSWVSYASRAELDSMERYNFISLLTIVLQIMQQRNTEIDPNSIEISDKAMELIIGAIDVNHSFFKPVIKGIIQDLIFGEWGLNYIYVNKDDPESISQFARFVISFLLIDLLKFSSSLLNPENDSKYQFLLNLTNFPGVPIEEESISKDFIDFWFQIAETFAEEEDSLNEILKNDQQSLKNLIDKSKALFTQVTHVYWEKIHVPNKSETIDDLENFNNEFRVYRRDDFKIIN